MIKQNKIQSGKIIITSYKEYDVQDIKNKITKIKNKIESIESLQKSEPDDETLLFWNETHNFSGHVNNLNKQIKKHEDRLNGNNNIENSASS